MEARYPIRAAARLTGISSETLRAWERRFGLVAPERAGRGRAYSEADVQKLRLLKALIDRGHSIGQLAALGEPQLRALLASEAAPASAPGGLFAGEIAALCDFISQYDVVGLERELARLAALVPPSEFAGRVAEPLMREVGDRWESGSFSVAQEHLTSAALRGVLGTLLRLQAPAEPGTRAVFATPAGEAHEFGLLLAAMHASSFGLGVVYLGPSLPAGEILLAARRTGARLVVLASTGAANGDLQLGEIRAVAAGRPPGLDLWVGGARSEEYASWVEQAGAVYLPSLDELKRRLSRQS